MDARSRGADRIARVAVGLTIVAVAASAAVVSAGSSKDGQEPARVPVWPCRLVVRPTLLGVIENGWTRSATLRRQCEALAAARAVVALEWGRMDSLSHALTRITRNQEGIIVAKVAIPPVRDAVALVAHELEHVLEATRGLNFAEASEKPGSGVWKAFGGFETQAAIDMGNQVRRELEGHARFTPTCPQSRTKPDRHRPCT